MSSRDKMSSTSLPREHRSDRAPPPPPSSSSSATTATKSRTSRQSTSGSHRDNNSKDNRTSSIRGGNASSKRPTTKNGSTTTKTTTRTTNKKHASGHASSANIDDSNELTTSGYSGEELKLSTNTDTSMSNPRAGIPAAAEQETNIDGGDLLDFSMADASASASASDEREESDAESSCLLSSSATLLDSPVNRPAQTKANGGPVAPLTSDLNYQNARIPSDTSAAASTTTTTSSLLPDGWEQHTDKLGAYYWHVSTGVIQRDRPTGELAPVSKQSVLVCHDDEEINQMTLKTSDSDDDEDYYESGAALTLDDTSETTFVVYPLGCCEFDETQLVSATSTKTIQKCILRLCNMPTAEESVCWGLDQSQPILMKLHQEYIQFTDLKTRNLLRSQPINSIKTWAVDDDNNFAFVIEDRAQQHSTANDEQTADFFESVDYALLSEPRLMCYVFRSMDDDDMSCKVAAKLNEEINRYKEQLSKRVTNSTRLQQMIVEPVPAGATDIDQITDAEEDFECLETSNEITLNVKYIGKTPVPRPTGIDVLNASIDKCLAEASNRAMIERSNSDQQLSSPSSVPTGEQQQQQQQPSDSTLIDAKLHVSPSSVIVENASNGEIIVECRIRYLTFMGISRRDIRWCGFIMQNSTNKTFVAHCFECHPTAGPVCDAIQQSCTRMFEKVIKNARRPSNETMSIIPTKSKIRNTLAKTFARIKLNNPIA